jgi:diguanylate cyclase (GGDEF)-like protein
MAERRESPTMDAFEDDLRIRSVAVGVFLTAFTSFAIAVYATFTWQQPHRSILMGAVVAAVAVGAALLVLPTEKVVRSRWREPFFLTWSALLIAIVNLLVIVDGTDESPLALVYVLPLIFAASSYPLWPTIVVCVADVGSCLGVGLSDGGADVSRAFILVALLSATAVMGVLQSRNHDHQRNALKVISRTDPLTGVLNRRGFDERLDIELRRARRRAEPLALVVGDIDHFKRLNDEFGHAAGDEALRRVADALRASSREMDVISRIGGEEFAMLMPATGLDGAYEAAERMRRALESSDGGRLTISFGAVELADEHDDPAALIARADAALYDAKETGRNRTVVAPR